MTPAPDAVLMRRDLVALFGIPVWPTGISLVPFADELALDAHALLRDAYREGAGEVPVSFVDWWLSVSSDEEFDPDLLFFARADDGRLAGFALCWTSGFIKDLAVASAFRRSGVATALLDTIFAAFAERGETEVRLKVRADNLAARRAYEKAGFTPA